MDSDLPMLAFPDPSTLLPLQEGLDEGNDNSSASWDFGCILECSPVPAVLSTETGSVAPCSSPVLGEAQHATMSRAVRWAFAMHPNLVNNLKAFILLSSSDFGVSGDGSSTSGGGGGGACITFGGGHSTSGGGCVNPEVPDDEMPTGVSESGNHYNHNGRHKRQRGEQQQQQDHDLYQSESASSPDGETVEGQKEMEAAVVSVDLIKNRRPFICLYKGCYKNFKNPQTLRMHHKTHYAEDSTYRIADVNAQLMSTFHRAGHNKKIPSGCPLCHKTFVGLYELRRHYGRKHTVGEKTFGCKKCIKKFYIEVDLRDHEKLCGEPIECKCGMKFAFKCNLVAHKKGHPECQDPPSEEPKLKGAAVPLQLQNRASRRKAGPRTAAAQSSAPVTAALPDVTLGASSSSTLLGSSSPVSSNPPQPLLAVKWRPPSPPSSQDGSPSASYTFAATDNFGFPSDFSFAFEPPPIVTPSASKSPWINHLQTGVLGLI